MALAETVGSAGSMLLIDQEKFTAVGVEINGNHLASVNKGIVTATATLLHRGDRTHDRGSTGGQASFSRKEKTRL